MTLDLPLLLWVNWSQMLLRGPTRICHGMSRVHNLPVTNYAQLPGEMLSIDYGGHILLMFDKAMFVHHPPMFMESIVMILMMIVS